MIEIGKFIKLYENKIKKLRKHYYDEGGSNKASTINTIFLINFMPLVIAILILVITSYRFASLIVALVTLVVAQIALGLIKKAFNLEENEFIYEIRKQGFLSVSAYEKKLNNCVFGEKGYYGELLKQAINDYKITKEETYTIKDLRNDTYLLHDNKTKDEIYIIKNTLLDTPKVMRIAYSNIRYYRADEENDRIILKTDMDELYYDMDSIEVFDKIMKNKSINEKEEYNPENYVKDFERYMSKIKRKDSTKKEESIKKRNKHLNILKFLFLLEIILIGIDYIYRAYTFPIELSYTIVLIAIFYNLYELNSINNIYIKNDIEYIEYLNKDKTYIDKFKELKLALFVPKEVNKIYSDKGAEFICWDNEGYFHLLLNMIYFDVIYVSVKVREVEYYKIDGNYCLLKIAGNTYKFSKEAKKVFEKLLPNKDYDWINGILK